MGILSALTRHTLTAGPMADGQLLVVDDEREITDLLEEHFRAAGYVVDIAHDGTQALVMLTGSHDEALARRLLRAGAFDYVAKPFRLEVLERVVVAAVAAGRRP